MGRFLTGKAFPPEIFSHAGTFEMASTDERAVGKTGPVARDSLETRNDFVSVVAVNQSILGRILNYGTVEVRREGTDNVSFGYIKKPGELRNTMQKYLADVADESQ